MNRQYGWNRIGYSLLGCDDVRPQLAVQMEVICSPQISVPVKLHTVTTQTWALNIFGQQDSHVVYIPVCTTVMLCCWVSSSQRIEGL